MKNIFASLRKAVLQGLKALSYADNGELLSLSSKIRILYGEAPVRSHNLRAERLQ